MQQTVSAIGLMVSVVDKKSRDLCQVVQDLTEVQRDDGKGHQSLSSKQIDALASREIHRKIKRFLLLKKQVIITEEEFKMHTREASGL